MLNWTRYPTTSRQPATARPATKATSAAQIDYVALDTQTPYDQALYRYLEKRRRLH